MRSTRPHDDAPTWRNARGNVPWTLTPLDIEDHPELPILAALHHTLHLALAALFTEYPQLVDDFDPDQPDLRDVHALLLAGKCLLHALASHRANLVARDRADDASYHNDF